MLKSCLKKLLKFCRILQNLMLNSENVGKILVVLNDNPTMKLDIRSHTDSRASHAYNEKLSDRRAKSTKDWLIKNGIAADRLTSEGLGETELVNKCADDVKCTEEEHQKNRRTTFRVVSAKLNLNSIEPEDIKVDPKPEEK